jgi:serine/threonine protein kinase
MLQAQQVLLERYQLQQSLEYNAGRQTWLAQDCSTIPSHPVIIKLLAFSPQMQWDELKLFEREAQVLKTLNHPRIPKYRDYFSLDRNQGEGLCWFALVQDYIPGRSLQQLLNEGIHFTEQQVRSLATQVLEILIYLHGLNPPVLHRDIKPSNLIWAEDEQVYLVDFGAVQDPTAVEGTTFTVVGTAGYAPLEQFYGKAVPASDLYALGASLVHLLTGMAPIDLPQQNLRIQFRHCLGFSSSFLHWIEKLIEPDLELRFSSAFQALEALNRGYLFNRSEPKSYSLNSSRIQIKKSPNQLTIKIPRAKKSPRFFIHFVTKLILGLGSFIFLLPPIFIGIGLAIYVMISIRTGNLEISAFLLIIPLIIFLCWSINRVKKELQIVHNELNLSRLLFFSHQVFYSHIDSNYIVIEQPIFSHERHISCRISNIQSIEVMPFEGVIIHSKKHRYVLGQGLTETECEYLVEEIKKWLSTKYN